MGMLTKIMAPKIAYPYFSSDHYFSCFGILSGKFPIVPRLYCEVLAESCSRDSCLALCWSSIPCRFLSLCWAAVKELQIRYPESG